MERVSESKTAIPRRSPKRHLFRLGLFLLIAVPLYWILWSCSPVYHARINTSSGACLANISQLAWAIRNYARGASWGLPAYTVDADGKKLHSWRTLILPMIEMRDLYDKIRLDEPWDSEHNRQFHDVVISLYRCRSDRGGRDQPTTNYFLVTGPGSLFDGAKPTFDKDFPDRESSSNTPLLIETSQSVHWMCPEDVSLDDYNAGSIPPVTPSHRNIVYTNLQTKVLFAPPWLSYFSPMEIFFGHTLPTLLLWAIPIVTVIQLCRFFLDTFWKSSPFVPPAIS